MASDSGSGVAAEGNVDESGEICSKRGSAIIECKVVRVRGVPFTLFAILLGLGAVAPDVLNQNVVELWGSLINALNQMKRRGL